MNRENYQILIAQIAATVFSGYSRASHNPEFYVTEAVKDAKQLAKLAGIEEPQKPAASVGMSQTIIGSPHIIDCDKDPYCPDWLTVESHKKGGQFTIVPEKIELFLTEKQKTDWVTGFDIKKELEGKNVLNANVLDYLLAHTELIPESWKGKYVYFWGTLYRDSDDRLYVRYLYWDGGLWDWNGRWLGRDFGAQRPAAVLQVGP